MELLKRPGTELVQCWKPANSWNAGAGGNYRVDAYIDSVAETFIAVAPARVHLVVHHEPENDGSFGTERDYRRMFANVRSRFDRMGVSNVSFGVAYMNYPKWSNKIDMLWPGDGLVDKGWFNLYGSPERSSWRENMSRMEDELFSNPPGGPDFAGVPWFVREFSIQRVPSEVAVKYFTDGYDTLTRDEYPWVKGYMVFDSPGGRGEPGLRIGYGVDNRPDPAKEQAYIRFANHPRFTGRTVPEPVNGPESFTCGVCGMESFHPMDVQYRYCGNCHDVTG